MSTRCTVTLTKQIQTALATVLHALEMEGVFANLRKILYQFMMSLGLILLNLVNVWFGEKVEASHLCRNPMCINKSHNITNKMLFHNKCFFKNSIVATLAASLFDADWCHLRLKWPVLHSKAETEKSRDSLYRFLPCITKLTRFYLDAKIKPFKKMTSFLQNQFLIMMS